MNSYKLKTIILSLAILLTQNVFSQDSIHKKNGEIIASKILEINQTEVKFKKSNHIDGPTYSEWKKDLFFIKFANGTIDTINRITSVSPPSNEGPLVIKYPQKISILYPDMGDLEILSMIESLPASASKSKLRNEYVLMKKYKTQQYLSCSLGWVAGFGIPVVVTYYALANNNYYNTSQYDAGTTIVIGALAGAAIRITGQVLYHVNKNKRKQARRNLMSIYNGIN